MTDASSADFSGDLRHWPVGRLTACWRFKLFLTFLLNLLFWAGYGYLSRHALFPVRTMPVTWIDELIPFQPTGWSAAYLSEFVFTTLVPWLLARREQLRRYAVGLLVLSSVSFLCFLFLPVASPRPSSLVAEGWYRFILECDGPYNAFPSLHAGFLAYTLMLVRRTWKLHAGMWLAVWGWAALVMVATIATRQHYAVDLLAGVFIGLAADAIAWRGSGKDANAATMTLRRKGATSQAGLR